MPAPTPLTVATQSINRLVKEESLYHKELDGQKTRIEKLEATIQSGTDDDNAEYVLKQEKTAKAETEAIFDPLHKRIAEAVAKLEEQIAISESEGVEEVELAKARDAMSAGRGVVGEEA